MTAQAEAELYCRQSMTIHLSKSPPTDSAAHSAALSLTVKRPEGLSYHTPLQHATNDKLRATELPASRHSHNGEASP